MCGFLYIYIILTSRVSEAMICYVIYIFRHFTYNATSFLRDFYDITKKLCSINAGVKKLSCSCDKKNLTLCSIRPLHH